MPTAPTLAELRDRVRRDTDYQNSDAVTDADLTIWINDGLGAYHDLVVASYEDYYVSGPLEHVVSAGVSEIDLDSVIPTFYKLRGIDYKLGTNDFYPLQRFNFNKRNDYRQSSGSFNRFGRVYRSYKVLGRKIILLPEDSAAGTYRIYWVPTYVPLVADGDTFNGENGWDKFVVLYASIEVKKTFEEDVSVYMAQLASETKRIENMAPNRDLEGPTPVAQIEGGSGYYDEYEDFY